MTDETCPPARQRFSATWTVAGDDPKNAAEFLALRSGLSKSATKDAMNKGAAWLARQGKRRLRRADTELRVGDNLELHYDRHLLATPAPTARCLLRRPRFSLWFKPSGLLAQGTAFGDHCSILRQVEKDLQPTGATAYLVHRLDREAAGIMLFAHDSATAATFSALFQANHIVKRYRIQVKGDLAAAHGCRGRINRPLDGKPALTEYSVENYDSDAGVSTVQVRLLTGRLHQIRRHVADLGFPVMGDPKYGRGNKNTSGMRLVASGLAFTDPYSGTPVDVQLAPDDIGF
jgi:tRNA pseudouridine32 synthase/23S rRNA pseudouridine746 synthase